MRTRVVPTGLVASSHSTRHFGAGLSHAAPFGAGIQGCHSTLLRVESSSNAHSERGAESAFLSLGTAEPAAARNTWAARTAEGGCPHTNLSPHEP